MPHKDKEKARLWRKAHYQANCERERARSKAYRKANKERLSAYHKNYEQLNKKRLKTRRRAYYETNPNRVRIWKKAWSKAYPEKVREHDRRKHIRRHATQIEPINDKIVFLRDGWICQICKKRVNKRFKYPNPMSASLDHIIPMSKGGSHTYDNVQLAHFSCNVSKQSKVLPQGEQMRMF